MYDEKKKGGDPRIHSVSLLSKSSLLGGFSIKKKSSLLTKPNRHVGSRMILSGPEI